MATPAKHAHLRLVTDHADTPRAPAPLHKSDACNVAKVPTPHERVAAYVKEHPKASATWVAVALRLPVARVESAMRAIVEGEMPSHRAAMLDRARAERAQLRADILNAFRLRAPGFEMYVTQVAAATGRESRVVKPQLVALEKLGKLTSVERKLLRPPSSHPRRYYRLAGAK